MQVDKQVLHVRSNRDTKHVGKRKYLKRNWWFWRLNPLSAGFGRREGVLIARGTRQDKTRQETDGKSGEPARAYDCSQTDRMAHTSYRRPPLTIAPPGHFPIQQVLTRDRGFASHFATLALQAPSNVPYHTWQVHGHQGT